MRPLLLDADTIIEPQGRLVVINNLIMNKTITLQGSPTSVQARIEISGDQSLLGQGTVLFYALEDNLNLNKDPRRKQRGI
jgi:hypothetical protein